MLIACSPPSDGSQADRVRHLDWLDGGVGEQFAKAEEGGGGGTDLELELFVIEEVLQQWVVAVDAYATVEVLGGVHNSPATLGGPELGGEKFFVAWSSAIE